LHYFFGVSALTCCTFSTFFGGGGKGLSITFTSFTSFLGSGFGFSFGLGGSGLGGSVILTNLTLSGFFQLVLTQLASCG
jgi:hypothetical protein